jgi:hypothetical protein
VQTGTIRSVAAGAFPREIALLPGAGMVAVTAFGSDEVWLFPTSQADAAPDRAQR